MNKLIVILGLSLLPHHAHAECVDGPIPCRLEEEAKQFLDASQFADAATKYKQSIAIKPTARAYLGLYRATLSLDRPATAYEALLEAQRYSDRDRQNAPSDPDVASRAESIAFKLKELAPKIALVRLRLPEGVTRDDILAVRREVDEDLREPFGRPVPIAAGDQTLTIVLKSGGTSAFTLHVSAGVEQEVEIPIAAKVDRGEHRVELHAQREASPRNTAAIAATVGTVALVGGAIAFGMWGGSTYDMSKREPDNAMQLDEWHAANDKRHAAIGLGIAGAGCAALATWLWIRGTHTETPKGHAAVLAPLVDQRVAGLQVGGRW